MKSNERGKEPVMLRLLKALSADNTDRSGGTNATNKVSVCDVGIRCEATISREKLTCSAPLVLSTNPNILSHMPDSEPVSLRHFEPSVDKITMSSAIPAPRAHSVCGIRAEIPQISGIELEQYGAPDVKSVIPIPSTGVEIRVRPNLFAPLATRLVSKQLSQSTLDSLTITRSKAPGLNETVFAREKQFLSAASNVPDNYIEWIGLYRSVPLAAIASMEILERDQLSISLKPHAVKALQSHRKPFVDLCVGRDRRSGAMIKAVMNAH